MINFKNIRLKTTFVPPVILPSLLFIILVARECIWQPERAQKWMEFLKHSIFHHFSWFYVLSVSLFIAVMLLLAMSRLGDIRLGRDEDEPEFPFLSWIAMLFAAGMGVGLMFFGVSEPMMHMAAPLHDGSIEENTKQAMLETFYHWGVHPWAIYGMIALALAYFGFRYRLPLSLRSTFYPLLKEKINGPFGAAIDCVALCATLFGIITTLGYGALQLNAGLEHVGFIEHGTPISRNLIIITVVSIAVLSAISGVGKGVRRLSEINLIIAMILLIFILSTGPTLHLLSAFSENMGYYLSSVVSMSFKTFTYDKGNEGWFYGWTVLYWAWWFSWAPFVGLFIARISKGRTIREFIFGVLIIPTLFNLFWFTTFGNAAIFIDQNVAKGQLALITAPEKMLFEFLQYFPLSTLLSFIGMVILSLFFITSADSGIFVLNSIASNGRHYSIPRWQSVLWGVIMMVLSIALLNSDGLAAVQAMTLLVALPFAVIMLIMCYALWVGLRIDAAYFDTRVNPGSVFWNGKDWKIRLDRILKQSQRADVEKFLQESVKPAMEELAEQLQARGLVVMVKERRHNREYAVELRISKSTMRDFIYGVQMVAESMHEDLISDDQMPNVQYEKTYSTETYFGDGRQGYDIQFLTNGEIIADILKQYQRYMYLIADESNVLMTQAPLGKRYR